MAETIYDWLRRVGTTIRANSEIQGDAYDDALIALEGGNAELAVAILEDHELNAISDANRDKYRGWLSDLDSST